MNNCRSKQSSVSSPDKVRRTAGIILLTLAGFALASCNMMDPSLVGQWGSNQVAWFEFTADSGLLVGTPPADATLTDTRTRYTCSTVSGSGTYWNPDFPDQTVAFTYTLSGDTLELTLPWASFPLERIVP